MSDELAKYDCAAVGPLLSTTTRKHGVHRCISRLCHFKAVLIHMQSRSLLWEYITGYVPEYDLKKKGFVPGYLLEYDPNNQVWYPGTYPSIDNPNN